MRFSSVVRHPSSVTRRAFAIAISCVVVSGAMAAGELVDRIVAIIDRDVIMLSEAEQAIGVLETSGGGQSELAPVVERMIEARLIEREVARFTGEPIPAELVDRGVADVRARFDTAEEFEAALAARGLSEAKLRAEIERQLEVNRYLERRFRALTYVTDDEIETYFSEEILSELPDERGPTLEEVDQIRRILEERRFNDRVEQWIEGLKSRARIRRYVW